VRAALWHLVSAEIQYCAHAATSETIIGSEEGRKFKTLTTIDPCENLVKPFTSIIPRKIIFCPFILITYFAGRFDPKRLNWFRSNGSTGISKYTIGEFVGGPNELIESNGNVFLVHALVIVKFFEELMLPPQTR
jgi:hypothetical protein